MRTSSQSISLGGRLLQAKWLTRRTSGQIRKLLPPRLWRTSRIRVLAPVRRSALDEVHPHRSRCLRAQLLQLQPLLADLQAEGIEAALIGHITAGAPHLTVV